MQNDKSKFKYEFKKRLYTFTLRLIEFPDKLPRDNVSKRIGDQLLRSGTSMPGNYIEGQSVIRKKELDEIANIFASSILTLKGKNNFKKSNILAGQKRRDWTLERVANAAQDFGFLNGNLAVHCYTTDTCIDKTFFYCW